MVSSVIDSDVVNFSVMQVDKAVQVPMDELEAAYQAWHDRRDLDQNGWLALASERIQVHSVSNAG
jgi:hypothetical protein